MGTRRGIDDNLPEVNKNPSEADKNLPNAKNNTFGLIKSAKATVGKIIPQYEYQIEHLNDLPTEFTEVNACLPQTKDALNHAINNLIWDEASSESIQSLAVGLESKVNELQNTFTQVAKETRISNDQTVLECYITILRPLTNPKSHRVEVLMLGMLRDLETLFSKRPLKPGCSQTVELKGVIERMSKVKPSVQESDLTKTGPSNVQNNSSGATGHQYNGGKGNNIYSGPGNYTINNHHGTKA